MSIVNCPLCCIPLTTKIGYDECDKCGYVTSSNYPEWMFFIQRQDRSDRQIRALFPEIYNRICELEKRVRKLMDAKEENP